MNLDRELFLAYVEEDNTQRAYFRVHPMLTVEGPAAEEGRNLWPDDGCLRIVPDRGEQHTFKDRMRQLNGWCVVDLTAFMPEANKIRTNKNYHPDRGETNHFILYSDAVHSVADRIFHQVFTGKPEEAAALAAQSVTPSFYLRDEDMMYGPINRENPAAPTAAEAMEALFATIACPDGVSRDFLCVRAEYDARPKQEPVLRMVRKKDAPAAEAAAPQAVQEAVPAQAAPQAVPDEQPTEAEVPAAPAEEKPAEAVPVQKDDVPLQVGQPLNILDENQTFEETITSLNAPVSGQANLLNRSNTTSSFAAPKPASVPTKLGGTPLQRGAAQPVVPQPRNKVQETVYNQVKVSRNEPPAESLPQGAQMNPVDNPVEAVEQAMRRAWQVKDARDRILEVLLSMDGVESALERRISRKIGVTDLQKAIHEHISALEAERIRVLVELNKAKSDQEAYQRETIASARQKAQNEINALEEKKQSLENNIALVKAELNQLTAQREELCGTVNKLKQEAIPEAIAQMLADSAMAVATPEEPLRLIPVSGTVLDAEALLSRVAKVCRSCGITYDKNHTLAALLCLALGRRMGIACASDAAAATFLQNIAVAMGWESSAALQESRDQRPMCAAAPVDGTPAVLMSPMPLCAPSARFARVILSENRANQAAASGYAMNQWPVIPLNLMRHVPVYTEANVSPVAARSLTALLTAGEVSDADIDRVLDPVLALTAPLSGAAMKDLRRFVQAAASLMDGGLATACDWAVMLWVLPSLDRKICDMEKVRLALTEYPLSAASMKV